MAHDETDPAVGQGVCWRLDRIYPGPQSTEFVDDLRAAYRDMIAVRDLATRCASLSAERLDPDAAQLCHDLVSRCLRAKDLLADLHVYCTALASIGEQTVETRDSLRRVSAISAQLGAEQQRFAETLASWPTAVFQALCDTAESPETAEQYNDLRRSAGERPTDRAIAILAPEASRAWSTLYERLARELVVPMTGPEDQSLALNMTQTIAVLTGPHAGQRHRVWNAIRAAWAPHETTVAAVLNSLAGHRIKVQQLTEPANADVRAPSCRENRVSIAVLEALIDSVRGRRQGLRVGLRLMAELMGKDRLDPWDLAAPCPESGGSRLPPVPVDEGLGHVQAAFAQVSPCMGEFVDCMRRNGWIDAQPGDTNRRMGAYQTSLRHGRHPLVFTNYHGRWLDLITLAHELGHAFHYWVLRDLPAQTHHLPMALAECASSFAEMQLRRRFEHVFSASDQVNRYRAWDEAQAAVAFLLNIGASYTFELELYTNRRKREMTASELCEAMRISWNYWFGSDISSYDDRGWVRKPHFSGSRSFNNYPYMVGYLVAVLLDDAFSQLDTSFFWMYETFLRDCASLSLQDLIQKHFGEDATTVSFWGSVLDRVEARVNTAAVACCSSILLSTP